MVKIVKKFFSLMGNGNQFGFTGESTWLIDASKKLSQNFYILATNMGALVLALAGAYASNFHPIQTWQKADGLLAHLGVFCFNCWWLFPIGFALLCIGGIGIYQDQKALEKKHKKLEKENRSVGKLKLQLESTFQECEFLRAEKQALHKLLVNGWLEIASRQLGLNTNERVTIYYEHNKNFYLLSRYSLNPRLKEENRHRQAFPIDCGVLSMAWQHQKCIDINCPIFSDDNEEYYDYLLKTYNYDGKILTMKSCAYIGNAIIDAGHHIGVIIFESETHDLFTEEKTKEICKYCDDNQSHMCQFVRSALILDRSKQAKLSTLNPELEILKELDKLQKK